MDFFVTLAELDAAVAALRPQIRGLRSMAGFNHMSASFSADVKTEETVLLQRRQLIINASDALKALQSDGYPAVPKIAVAAEILTELGNDISNIAAAKELFEPLPVLVIVLGAAVDRLA